MSLLPEDYPPNVMVFRDDIMRIVMICFKKNDTFIVWI